MEAAIHSDLVDIAIVALAALACGLALERLRQPAVVGYILAGVILGPSGFAVVQDRAGIDFLAELGVLMLLFVVGMELSVRLFKHLWRLYVVATLCQICVSTLVMLVLSRLFGWSFGLALVLGFAVALSSTAVAIKVLQDIGEAQSRVARVTVGILIAQDLAVVPMMLIIGALSDDGFRAVGLLRIVLSLGLLAILITWLGRGPRVRLPFADWVQGHADLAPLAALVLCFGGAAITGLLGLSAAYGAFLAGMVIGNSRQRHSFSDVRPIQSVLLMVFFLSIGLLIDLRYVWQEIGTVLMLLFLVAFFKTALNIGILRAMGQPWTHAFLTGVVMAQIGEFSFLLSLTAVDSGLLDGETTRLVVAVTALSLTLSPLWVITARRVHALAQDHITSARQVLDLVYGQEVRVVAGGLEGMRGQAVRATAMMIAAGRRIRESRGKRAQPAAALDSAPAPQTTAEPAIEPAAAPAAEATDPPMTTAPVRKRRTRKPKGTVSGGNGGNAGLPDGT
jgi:CPA2 family monovalent cation:H+ antiporter-2